MFGYKITSGKKIQNELRVKGKVSYF